MELTIRELLIRYSCVEFWRNSPLLNFTSIKKINKNTNRKGRKESGSKTEAGQRLCVLFCLDGGCREEAGCTRTD